MFIFLGCKSQVASIEKVLPAVTCSVQATYLTGKFPDEHGIVANGWYFRDECEVKFWRQSNKLVQSPKIWEIAKSIDSTFTCANLFGGTICILQWIMPLRPAQCIPQMGENYLIFILILVMCDRKLNLI